MNEETNLEERAKLREQHNEAEIQALNDKSNHLFYVIVGLIIIAGSVLLGLFYSWAYISYIFYGVIILGIGEILKMLYRVYRNTKN